MTIKLATEQEKKEIILFFNKYLDITNDAITCEEFLCPFGVSSAIKRKQVIVAMNDFGEIIASVRFYPRKRDNIVSVYQFAIDEKFRGQSVLKKMLIATNYKNFEVLCPLNSGFNKYYEKTNWSLKKKDKKFNVWNLSV
jgi:hypothetical protein